MPATLTPLKVSPSVIRYAALLPTPLLKCTPPASSQCGFHRLLAMESGCSNMGGFFMLRIAPPVPAGCG